MNLIAKMTKAKVLFIAATVVAITTWAKIALDKIESNYNEMWE